MLNNQVNLRQVVVVIMSLLLVVPYSTGAIWYGFKEGFFPIQPRNYLVGIVGLLSILAFAKRPRISLSVVVLLALIILRIGDTFFLHRVSSLDQSEVLSTLGAALAYALGIVFLCGDPIALRQSALWCGILTIVFCCGINAWEWQNPGYFSTDEGRSAGMLGNANASAGASVAMLGLVLSMTPPLWLAAAAICSAGIGVFFTLSRGGAIVWLLVTVAYLMIVAKGRLRRVLGFAFWVALLVFLMLRVIDFENPLSSGRANASTRDVSNRERELFGLESIDANDTSRVDLLLDGLEGVRQQPVLGYGTGASWGFPYRPHNEFIAVWLDNGIVGMVLFSLGLCLLVGNSILKNKVLIIGCIPLIAEIPFSQNLLDDKSYLFAWIAIAAMLQFQGESESSVFSGENPRLVWGDAQDGKANEVKRPALCLGISGKTRGLAQYGE
jgi:O-Antigen ligase